MRLALLLAALAAALLLPRATSAFEADNAAGPNGTASFADPDVTLGREGTDDEAGGEEARRPDSSGGGL